MQTYNKYLIKKNQSNGNCLIDENGNPVLGDILKENIRFEKHNARILNVDFLATGIFYKEIIQLKNEKEDLNELSKVQLIEKCESLELDSIGNKADLIQRIEEKLKGE